MPGGPKRSQPQRARSSCVTQLHRGSPATTNVDQSGSETWGAETPTRVRNVSSDALMPAFVGSLAGYGVYVLATGNGLRPIFDLPRIAEMRTVDLAWAAAAGVASAAVAYLFAGAVRLALRVAMYVPRVARPALGGLALGLLAVASPHALTNGELELTALTTGVAAAGTLVLAAGAKLAAAVVAMAGEWRGGFIIPLFFVGACLGSAAHIALPDTNQWVLVTAMMVGCNAAVTKTPLGSALVVTEMAGVRLLPTVLIAALALTGPIRVIETQRRQEEEAADDRDRPRRPLISLLDDDYRALAAFRTELRRFLQFSEEAALAVGISPQQHQALLAIRGHPGPGPASVSDVGVRRRHRPPPPLGHRAAGPHRAGRPPPAAGRSRRPPPHALHPDRRGVPGAGRPLRAAPARAPPDPGRGRRPGPARPRPGGQLITPAGCVPGGRGTRCAPRGPGAPARPPRRRTPPGSWSR